jgi:hypothetical protein
MKKDLAPIVVPGIAGYEFPHVDEDLVKYGRQLLLPLRRRLFLSRIQNRGIKESLFLIQVASFFVLSKGEFTF